MGLIAALPSPAANDAVRDCDVLIVGAGPAGMALALSLSDLGLQVSLIEQQAEALLADPADDGREIALHHASMQMLKDFGALADLGEQDISPIASARVFNGRSPRFLDFAVKAGQPPAIGYLIANWQIRRGLYRQLKTRDNIQLLCERRMRSVSSSDAEIRVNTDQSELCAKLLVAADSRHSPTRQALGIAARMHDFGKTMLVCRVEHADEHEGVACEWFDIGRTIATLPLHGRRSSLAITLPHAEAEKLAQMPAEQFGETLAGWLRHRLGPMQLVSPRFRYPLLATYAQRFIARRAVLVGDAAVGMHPVTAHGFNFGLHSQHLLAQAIGTALRRNEDYASERVLRGYEHKHRRHTLPLYLATNAIVDLYTSREPAARLARELGIALGSRLPPFKQAVLRQLTRGAQASS